MRHYIAYILVSNWLISNLAKNCITFEITLNSLCLVKLFCKYSLIYIPSKKKKLEDAIGVIRNRKLQMDSQSNGQRKTSKNINNDLQNTTQKTGE
jgi:hypothetical protein